MFKMFELMLVAIWLLSLAVCVTEYGGCVILVGTFVFVIGFIITHI